MTKKNDCKVIGGNKIYEKNNNRYFLYGSTECISCNITK